MLSIVVVSTEAIYLATFWLGGVFPQPNRLQVFRVCPRKVFHNKLPMCCSFNFPLSEVEPSPGTIFMILEDVLVSFLLLKFLVH